MHGFFMDAKLHARVRDAANPSAYEDYVAEQAKKRIEDKRNGDLLLIAVDCLTIDC